MTAAAQTTCPSCGTPVTPGARFCEGCGTPLTDAPASSQAAPPTTSADGGSPTDPLGAAPISAPTRLPATALRDPVVAPATRLPCQHCGGEVGPDLYCTECGTKAPSERDHFREVPASWVAGVCDKGVGKVGNEDAMALLAAAEPGSRAVLVVMDGVSNSLNSAEGSLNGARAAREVLRMPLPAGMGTPESRAAAVTKVFNDAVKAANTAIVAVTDPDSPNPASATFTAVVLEDGRVHYANIGDSRAYWLPDEGEGVLLTVDDSIAQQQIASGVPREVAESSAQAHAITKWLGRDAEDITPMVGAVEVSAPGWVMACSDGMWNYASEPTALQEQIRAAGPLAPVDLAQKLVDYANSCGGRDNITVALARVGPLPEPPEPPAAPQATGSNPPGAVPPPPPAPPAAGVVPPPPPPAARGAGGGAAGQNAGPTVPPTDPAPGPGRDAGPNADDGGAPTDG